MWELLPYWITELSLCMNNWMHSFYFFSLSLFTSGLFNVAELSNKSVAGRKSEPRLITLCEWLFFPSLSQNWNNLEQLREEWDCGEKDICGYCGTAGLLSVLWFRYLLFCCRKRGKKRMLVSQMSLNRDSDCLRACLLACTLEMAGSISVWWYTLSMVLFVTGIA